MEQLFNDLQKHVADKMGNSVSLIDEDCGQLETLASGEDQYPVTFPCVLIGVPEVKWETLISNAQKGSLILTIRLAFDCYDDTHYGSTQEQLAAWRLQQSKKLNDSLHGWRFDGCATVMARTFSRQFSLPGGIKVYEHQYSTTVIDEIVQNNES